MCVRVRKHEGEPACECARASTSCLHTHTDAFTRGRIALPVGAGKRARRQAPQSIGALPEDLQHLPMGTRGLACAVGCAARERRALQGHKCCFCFPLFLRNSWGSGSRSMLCLRPSSSGSCLASSQDPASLSLGPASSKAVSLSADEDYCWACRCGKTWCPSVAHHHSTQREHMSCCCPTQNAPCPDAGLRWEQRALWGA